MADEKKGASPWATGVAGAVIGAAAAAAAIALSDEKTRKKAEKALGDMQKEGNKIFQEITKVAMDLRERGERALDEAKKSPKKLTEKKN
ncbi:hypothetical protein HYW41_05230 [Candidatus Daviesbacteria bacterium]|nr:hypothetical protein [Candidatus Daviesbacteria bacterium]